MHSSFKKKINDLQMLCTTSQADGDAFLEQLADLF